MLFPWARCLVWSLEHGRPMLAPQWRTFRVGPWLRGERDRRQYQQVLGPGSGIGGWRRMVALATRPRVGEEEAKANPSRRPSLIVFRGMKDYFAGLVGHDGEIRRELERCVDTAGPTQQADPGHPYLAVHVRLGDFAPYDRDLVTRGEWNMRLPLEWYVGAIETIRSFAGCLECRVYSDGRPEELGPILSLEKSRLASTKHAPLDLLDMSRASALVASGSTFSMWASFLGQVPTVWHPGQRRAILLRASGQLEPEWAIGGAFPNEFPAAVVGKEKG